MANTDYKQLFSKAVKHTCTSTTCFSTKSSLFIIVALLILSLSFFKIYPTLLHENDIKTETVTDVFDLDSEKVTKTDRNHKFSRKVDNSDLFLWDQKPQNTWHQHFQIIFRDHNISLLKNSNPELECDSDFGPTITDNMAVVKNYSFNVSQTLLQDLSLDDRGIAELAHHVTIPAKLPVIVTAASSNHYPESQGLIQTYHQKLLPLHKNLTMIYYDIGLKTNQREELRKYCKCEVRIFQFQKYPKHLSKLSGYAWKPVIIQTVLKEHDLVMWADASVRFLGKSLDKISIWARERGFYGETGDGSICERTSKVTFHYLKENPCLFNFPELHGTWMTISRNEFTLRYIMKPWVSCSLSENCMTYKNSESDLSCSGGHSKCHLCHRFDQSVLGIIMTRLFQKQRNLIESKFTDVVDIQRGHQPNYFQQIIKKDGN